MCGFVGYIYGADRKLENDKEILDAMMERIVHRGPDSAGVYTDDDISLGFRRLSIIDLSDCGNQPFYSKDGRYVMVFNGEIYNYKTLRKDLKAKGYEFISETDSEVIIRGFEEYGEDIVAKLRGMFAFCIWDTQEKRALLARDGFGIKPLYYTDYTTDGSLLFGSEIKSFLDHPNFIKALNKEAIQPFLTFQYNPLDETLFKGVYKLEPAHYMLYQNGKMQTVKYWDKAFHDETSEPAQEDIDYYVEKIKASIDESVELHAMSDVKVGSFLSGGVDSSLVTALLEPQQSFSVGFKEYEDMFNETIHAQKLSEQLGIENKSRYISGQQAFDNLEDIIYYLDEPDANYSIVPLYFLNQLAAENVTVVLSGEGADELFGGYEWYQPSHIEKDYYNKLPLGMRRFINRLLPSGQKPSRLKQLAERSVTPVEEKFIGQALVFPDAQAHAILNEKYRSNQTSTDICAPYYAQVAGQSDLQKMQYLDLNVWMPGDILLKADKMSMAHSLELRVPFLDKEVMEMAKGIPDEYRTTAKQTKVALRKAAEDVLPEEWAKRKKLGFPTPIRHWLREEPFYSNIKAMFESDLAAEFFDQETLLQLLEDHRQEKADLGHQIYAVYVFLLWYTIYFIKDQGACKTLAPETADIA